MDRGGVKEAGSGKEQGAGAAAGEGETVEQVGHWGVKRLVRGAGHGKEGAIRELERRGAVSEEELRRWRERREGLVKRCEKMTKINRMKKKAEEKEEGKEGGGKAVELEVVRVAANPRVLVCWYEEGGERRECLVKVRSNAKFRRGMRFEMAGPGEGEGKEWEYVGVLPRFMGRW